MKISVIVPAYNVGKYIYKCVLSLLSQTFSDYEVIVVNDGSTDETPMEIQKFNEDSRLKILTTNNRGVSAARNLGIEVSSGDYLVFVDGDDYVAEDHLSYLYSLVESQQTEFAFSTNCYVRADQKQVRADCVSSLSNEEGVACLLNPDVVVGCWNKIYKKAMLIREDIVFDSALFYGEGLDFITKVANCAHTIVVGRRRTYFYRQNNCDSATKVFNVEKIYNGEKSLMRLHERLSGAVSERAWTLHICTFYLGALVQLLNQKKKHQYSDDYERWLGFIRQHVRQIRKDNKISFYRKSMIVLGSAFPRLMAIADAFRRRKKTMQSVK